MAVDPQASIDAQALETSEVQPRRSRDIGFDAKLAPTCMMWSMIAALGFLILTMLFWGISNLPQLFR